MRVVPYGTCQMSKLQACSVRNIFHIERSNLQVCSVRNILHSAHGEYVTRSTGPNPLKSTTSPATPSQEDLSLWRMREHSPRWLAKSTPQSFQTQGMFRTEHVP